MQPIDFCRWLQGYFEIREASGKDKEQLTQAQINLIEQHLQLVFKKVTSSLSALPNGSNWTVTCSTGNENLQELKTPVDFNSSVSVC